MAAKLIGGSGSNKVVQSKVAKSEPKARGVNVGATDMLGQAVAFQKPDLTDGRGYTPPRGPTDNVAAVGVGGGRTIHQCGSQSATPAAKPMAKGHDILRDYGPDRK